MPNPVNKPVNRRIGWAALGLGGALVMLAFLAGREWGIGAQIAAMAYAVLVTIFLLAQIAGFIWTQTHYVESVENTKLRVLEAEAEDPR